MNDVRLTTEGGTQDPASEAGRTPAVYAPHPAVLSPILLPAQISVGDIVRRFLRGWWIILATVALCFLLAFAVLKLQPVEFTATMVVTATSDTVGTPSSSVQGVVTSLLGVGGASTEKASSFTQFRYLLTSKEIADRLVERNGLLPVIFSGEWNAETQSWEMPQSLGSKLGRLLRGTFGLPAYVPPSPERLASYLSSRLQIENVETTPLVSIAFSNRNPDLARDLLRALYAEGEGLLKEGELARTQQNVDFIRRQMATTNLTAHRQAFEGLLLQQLAHLVLLQSDAPFAATLVQPPYVDVMPTSPRPALVLALAVVGGLMVGFGMVLFIDALRGR